MHFNDVEISLAVLGRNGLEKAGCYFAAVKLKGLSLELDICYSIGPKISWPVSLWLRWGFHLLHQFPKDSKNSYFIEDIFKVSTEQCKILCTLIYRN